MLLNSAVSYHRVGHLGHMSIAGLYRRDFFCQLLLCQLTKHCVFLSESCQQRLSVSDIVYFCKKKTSVLNFGHKISHKYETWFLIFL